jgi:hypothetical protein
MLNLEGPSLPLFKEKLLHHLMSFDINDMFNVPLPYIFPSGVSSCFQDVNFLSLLIAIYERMSFSYYIGIFSVRILSFFISCQELEDKSSTRLFCQRGFFFFFFFFIFYYYFFNCRQFATSSPSKKEKKKNGGT